MSRLEMKADARRWRRGDMLAIFGAVALGAVLAMIILSIQNLQTSLQESNARGDALAEQVRQLGAVPVEPGSTGDAGPAGPEGPRGPQGIRGPEGQAGEDGSNGKNGKDSTVPGPTGAAGQPGSDSTVPGPAGPAGPAGQDGTDGADGADGQDGAPGEPPYSWQYQDPKGVNYTCNRVDGFDPAAPRYTCTADDLPGPLQQGAGIAALAGLAMYRRL